MWLEKLAPHTPVSQYRHNMGEDNADAHMKLRQIMGREVVVAVTDGRLVRHLGADLRRIRRPPAETGIGKDYRRCKGDEKLLRLAMLR
ncbi:MAG: YjbQ family protein [Desulfobacterales bacterium]